MERIDFKKLLAEIQKLQYDKFGIYSIFVSYSCYSTYDCIQVDVFVHGDNLKFTFSSLLSKEGNYGIFKGLKEYLS